MALTRTRVDSDNVRTHTEITLGNFTFTGDDVISAEVTEAVDGANLTLPIGEAELSIYSEAEGFSVINPTSDFQGFRKWQPVTIYEVVDGVRIYIGLYFLNRWENTDKNITHLYLVDQIGMLENFTCYGGLWTSAVTLRALCDIITSISGIKIIIDPELQDIELTGWLPVQTCREALHQIAFAAGVSVITSRQPGFIKIGQPESVAGQVFYGVRSGVAATGQSRNWQRRWRTSTWEYARTVQLIRLEDILNSVDIEQLSYISGVELISHNYEKGNDTSTLFEGTLPEGTHEIIFEKPSHNLQITGGTLNTEEVNRAIITVASEGTVTITGDNYIDNRRTHRAIDNYDNVIRIENSTLVNAANAPALVEKTFSKVARRLKQKSRLLSLNVLTGDIVTIQNTYRQIIRGTIEQSVINLAGGFISAVEIIGSIYVPEQGYYTGVSVSGASRIRQRGYRRYEGLDFSARWWDNAEACWIPKGAANKDAALIDLTGNGNDLSYTNYDDSGWSAENGWAGSIDGYFDTGIVPQLEQTIYVAITDANSLSNYATAIGAAETINGTLRHHFIQMQGASSADTVYRFENIGYVDTRRTTAVIAINKAGFWVNGTEVSDQSITDDYPYTINIFIGARNGNGTADNFLSDGYIVAACIVNATDDDDTIRARTYAMQKLIGL